MGEELTGDALGVSASLSGRRWVWREAEERIGQAIAQRLGLSEIVGRLIASRGIDAEGAKDFLDPTLRALMPDPSCITDMDNAAARLAEAVRRRETVGVFGDYDVDGACSGAIMSLLLRRLGCTTLPHVPDRMAEGYGPNAAALAGLADRGASLIVCVDCGTAAADILATIDGRADVHRARPSCGTGSTSQRLSGGQSEPAGLCLRPADAVRRRGRIHDGDCHPADAAKIWLLRDHSGARPERVTRPRGPLDSV